MSTTFLRPRMPITRDTAFWLEGAALGELRIQRCANCATLRHPPRPMCPQCNSVQWDWKVASGRGTVYSFIIYHHQPISGLPVPYAVLVVQLDEGTRVVGNLLGGCLADLRIGAPVQVEFVADEGDDYVVPQWRLVDADTAGGRA